MFNDLKPMSFDLIGMWSMFPLSQSLRNKSSVDIFFFLYWILEADSKDCEDIF